MEAEYVRYYRPRTMNTDGLPGIWSPVQWELNKEERVEELDTHSTATLLWSVDSPEAILRLLLQETDIQRLLEPPKGYESTVQGNWVPERVTIGPKYPLELIKVNREPNYLYLEYRIGDSGY
jgi:hypothetical protein